MSGLFFVRIFGMCVERGADAVGRFGVRRETELESAVEHFFNFWRFCSTLEPARGGFGVGGRTFFQILEILFYFGARAGRIWSRR